MSKIDKILNVTNYVVAMILIDQNKKEIVAIGGLSTMTTPSNALKKLSDFGARPIQELMPQYQAAIIYTLRALGSLWSQQTTPPEQTCQSAPCIETPSRPEGDTLQSKDSDSLH